MFIDGLANVLQKDNQTLCKELGISKATLHRWKSKGLPPVMSVGTGQRLQTLVFEALRILQEQGEEKRYNQLLDAYKKQSMRDRVAINAWELSNLKIYSHDQIAEMKKVISQARDLWALKCASYYKEHGDVGTCVGGAGFYLSFLPDGSKKPRAWLFLPSHSVSPCQGSAVWEDSKDEVLEFLKAYGIDCAYDYGRMD